MANSCQGLAKFALVLNVLIYFVGGGCLILLGSLIIDNAGSAQNLIHSTYVLLPSVIMLISGLFMVALAFVGCFACLKQTRCLNNTFFTVMFIIILIEIAALGLSIRYKTDIEDFAENALKTGLERYDDQPSFRKEFDLIQKKAHCCGILNYTDWYNTSYFKTNDHFPNSCCKNDNCTVDASEPVPDDIFTKGCLVDVEAFFEKYFVFLIVGYTIFILIQGSALIATCVINRNSDLENTPRYSAFNPDV